MFDLPLEETVRVLRRRLWIERGVFLLVLAVGAVVWLRPQLPQLSPGAWAVYVDGKPVAALRSRESAEAVLQKASRPDEAGGPPVTVTQPVRVAPISPEKLAISDPEAALQKVAEAVKLRADRAVIYIDGIAVVALPDEAQANSVLEDVKSGFAGKLEGVDAAPTFKQTVEVRVGPAEEELWADRETALGLLRGEGADEEGRYVVASGDTAWVIAEKHDLTLKKLEQYNPGVRLNRLQVGQSLRLGEQDAPLLTVVTEGRVTRTVSTSYGIRLQRSPKMFTGKRMLVQAGRPGRERVTYRVRCENGKVVSQEPIRRDTVSAARNQVVVLGTKRRT